MGAARGGGAAVTVVVLALGVPSCKDGGARVQASDAAAVTDGAVEAAAPDPPPACKSHGSGSGTAEACTLSPITADQTVDFDARTFRVSGTLTLNGGVLPDHTEWRGFVVFADRRTGDQRSAELRSKGPGTFSASLFAGRYDVHLQTSPTTTPGGVVLAQPPGFPLSARTHIASDLEIAGNCTLDFDVRSYPVTGTVTLNGAPLPDHTGVRGSVVFRDRRSGRDRSAAVGASGSGSYALTLFAGSYDVLFQTHDSVPPELPPRTATVIASGVTIGAEAPGSGLVLDYDLAAYTVSGTVTLNGAPLKDHSANRGTLAFRDQRTGRSQRAPVGATGAGAYTARLFAGSYDVLFETLGISAPTWLPSQGETLVASGVTVDRPASLDYDLRLVTVTGVVTQGGAPLGDRPGDRGAVYFRDTRTGDLQMATVGATGAAGFSARVYAGTYDVSFAAGDVAPPLRAGVFTRIAEDLVIAADRTLDHDLNVYTVAGTLTLAGAPFPDHSSLRGSLHFRDRRTGSVQAAAIPPAGPASYALGLYPGTYDVTFVTTPTLDFAGLPADATTVVASGLTVDADLGLDHDLRVHTVSGTVTLNGATLGSNSTSRGNVVFRDQRTGLARQASVGSSGPGSYSLSVFESAYDTLFVTSDAATPATLPYDARTEFGTGCPLPGTCDASAANLSGRWTSTFEGGTPANLVLALADEEGAITGTYVEQGYSGVVAGGVANGAVELRATLQTTTSAGTFCVYRGTLTSACSMSGTYWCSGSSGAWIWFTAYR